MSTLYGREGGSGTSGAARAARARAPTRSCCAVLASAPAARAARVTRGPSRSLRAVYFGRTLALFVMHSSLRRPPPAPRSY